MLRAFLALCLAACLAHAQATRPPSVANFSSAIAPSFFSQRPTLAPASTKACNEIVLDHSVPPPYKCNSPCIFEFGISGSPDLCRNATVCDVTLNFTLPSPFGCPSPACDLVTKEVLPGVVQEVCAPATFETLFDNIYWGLSGYYPFGYLFWNILLALCIIFYLQFAPWILGWAVTKVLNRAFLKPNEQFIVVGEVAVMLLGGRLSIRNIEYISPNLHVKCLEMHLSIKWWLGSADIRQGPLPSKLMSPEVWQALPFRMNMAFLGLDISVFNNTSRYGGLEDFILRNIFREVFGRDPPSEVNEKRDAKSNAKPSMSVRAAWQRAKRFFVRRDSRSSREGQVNDSRERLARKSESPSESNFNLPALREPLPRFYSLFPITHVLLNETVIYVGAPTLPSTLIVCITRASGRHYAEAISLDAPNHDLDSYCIVNTFDLRGVTMQIKPNPGYVAEDELQAVRSRLEQEARLVARDALSEMMRNVKRNFADAKTGIKDVREDIKHVLTGAGERRADGAFASFFEDAGEEKVPESFPMDSKTSRVDLDEEEGGKPEGSGEELQKSDVPANAPSSPFIPAAWRAHAAALKPKPKEKKAYGTIFSNKVKRGPRDVPEPDLLRTDRVELVLYLDKPGRLSSPGDASMDSFPAQSLTVALGSENEETVITYGPWADKQRSLFQEHFFPFAFQDQQVFSPQIFREAIQFKVKVVCAGQAAFRLPHRSLDPGGFASFKPVAGSGDGGSFGPGQKSEAEFFAQVLAQMARVTEEHRRVTEVQQFYRSNPFSSSSTSASGPHNGRVAPDRDGWWYSPHLDLNQVLAKLPPNLDENSLSRFVDRFNAIIAFQRALVIAAKDLPEIPLQSTELWSEIDKARWFWGAYAGREMELLKVTGLERQSVRELGYAISMLPSALPLDELAKLSGLPDAGADLDFLQAQRAFMDDETILRLEIFASDPRAKLHEWLPLPTPFAPKADKSASASKGSSPEPLRTSAPEDVDMDPVPRCGGPLEWAERNGSVCGWIDLVLRPNSTVLVVYPWYPRTVNGSRLEVVVDLKSPSLTTSATSCLGMEADHALFKGAILYPLEWNGEQIWDMHITVQTPKLYMLRCDMEACMDLVRDWSSNAYDPPSVAFFIPSRLSMRVDMRNAEWTYLVNQGNVVAKIDDRKLNRFILLSVPTVGLTFDARYTEYRPSASNVNVSLRFAYDADFNVPSRASLVLPEKHPLRQVPLPVAVHGQGGATNRPDPAFIEFKEMKMNMSFSSNFMLDESAVDTMEVQMSFDDYRLTCYPEALDAIDVFMRNYLSFDLCPVSYDAYRASGCRNLKTVVAFRNWYEDPKSLVARLFPMNSFDTVARLTVFNGIILLPTAVHPLLSPTGVIVSPEDECISIFTREFAVEMRMSQEHLENSMDVSPVRILAPKGSKKAEVTTTSATSPMDGTRGTAADSAMMGQIVVDGIKGEMISMFGLNRHDVLSPLVCYRQSVKAHVGAIWGDVDVHQVALIRNAMNIFEVSRARISSSDAQGGGTKQTSLLAPFLGYAPLPVSLPRSLGQTTTTSFTLGSGGDHGGNNDDDLSVIDIEQDLAFESNGKIENVVHDRVASSNFSNETPETPASPMPWRADRRGSFLAGDFSALFGEQSPATPAIEPDSKAEPVVLLRLQVLAARGLPRLKKGFSTLANSWVQAEHGGQVMRTPVCPDTSAPEWNEGYTFLADADDDLGISVIDGTYGRQQVIGTVSIGNIAAAMQDALRSYRTSAPVKVFESVWVSLDASKSAPTYASRVKPAPSNASVPTLSPLVVSSPQAVLTDRGSKYAAIKLQLIIVALDASRVLEPEPVPFWRIFGALDARWKRRDLVDCGPPGSRLLPQASVRRASSPELLAVLVPNAATHIVLSDATQRLVQELALKEFALLTGPVSLCVWTRANSVFEFRLSDASLSGDTECTPLASMRVCADKAIACDLTHVVRVPVQVSKVVGDARWAVTAKVSAVLDVRVNVVRRGSSWMEQQQRFLEVHDQARAVRLKQGREVLRFGVGGIGGTNSRDLFRIRDPVPLGTIARRPLSTASAHVPTMSLTSISSFKSPSVDEDIDGRTRSSSSSVSEGSLHLETASSSFESAEGGSHNGEDHVESIDVVFVSGRTAALPMLGSPDPYNTGLASLSPFLQTVLMERVVESNDFWYGAAFDWIRSGYGPGHKSGEGATGMFFSIPQSARTYFKDQRPPAVGTKLWEASWQQTAPQRAHLSLPRLFQPVEPRAMMSLDAAIEEVEETMVVRIVLPQPVDALVTPVAVAALEEAEHQMSLALPSVAQTLDFFELNYLVLRKDGTTPLAKRTSETKLLVSLSQGLNLRLVHGARVAPDSAPISDGDVAGAEAVYASWISAGPVHWARLVRHSVKIPYERTTLDVLRLALTMQVASGFEVDSTGAATGASPGSIAFPVVRLSAASLLVVHATQERTPERGLLLTSRLNGALSDLDLVAGVDSVYVTYSVLMVWSDLISGFLREQLALWHRQRRRWAVLAGQLLRLAHVIEDAESKGDKESRVAAALISYCKGASPGADMEPPAPGWDTLVRARRIACFLSDVEKIEYHMGSLPVDRFADVAPVPLEVSSGVASELQLRRGGKLRSATSTRSFVLHLAEEFFRGVGNRHIVRKRPLSEMKITYEISLREFRAKIVDTAFRGAPRGNALAVDSRNPLPVFAVALRPATHVCMVVELRPSSLAIQRVLAKVASGVVEDGNSVRDAHLHRTRLVAGTVDVQLRGVCGGVHVTTSPELILATRAGLTVARHYREVDALRANDRRQAEALHRAEIRQAERQRERTFSRANDMGGDMQFDERVARLDRLLWHSPRHQQSAQRVFHQSSTTSDVGVTFDRRPSSVISPRNRTSHSRSLAALSVTSTGSARNAGESSPMLSHVHATFDPHEDEASPGAADEQQSAANQPSALQRARSMIFRSSGPDALPAASKDVAVVSRFALFRSGAHSSAASGPMSPLNQHRPSIRHHASSSAAFDEDGPSSTTQQQQQQQQQRRREMLGPQGDGEDDHGDGHAPTGRAMGEKEVLVSLSLQYALRDVVFRFTALRSASGSSRAKNSSCVTLSFSRVHCMWNRHPSSAMTSADSSANHRLQDFVLVTAAELRTRVEGAGSKDKNNTPWVIDASVSQVAVNSVTALPSDALDADRFSRMRVLFNGKGSIIDVPLYAIDNSELHDYVDHWLEALRIASEHAVVMRKPGPGLAVFKRHGSSYDDLLGAAIKEDSIVPAAAPLQQQQQHPVRLRSDAGGVWPDPFGFAADPSFVSDNNNNKADAGGSESEAEGEADAGYSGSTKRTPTAWRAAQAAVRQGVALHVVSFEAILRLTGSSMRIRPLETVAFTWEIERFTSSLESAERRSMAWTVDLGSSELQLRKQGSRGLALAQALPQAWMLASTVEVDVSPVVKVRMLVEPVEHSFTPVVIQQFLALQSSLATELSVLLEAIAKVSEERRINRRKVADALGLAEAEKTGYHLHLYLAGAALRATALPLEHHGELPSLPWGEMETSGVDVSLESMPNGSWQVMAKLMGLRLALCRRRKDRPDDAISALEVNTNVELASRHGVDDAPSFDVVIRQSGVVTRPGFEVIASDLHSRFSKALSVYNAHRQGLEKIDTYAKRVWENVTTDAAPVAAKLARFEERFSLFVDEVSVLVPFELSRSDLGATLFTLRRLKLVGRTDDDDDDDLTLAKPRPAKRRFSSDSSIAQVLPRRMARFVVRIDASDFALTFRNGAEPRAFMGMLYVSSVGLPEVPCNVVVPSASLSGYIESPPSHVRASVVVACAAPLAKTDRSIARFLVSLHRTYTGETMLKGDVEPLSATALRPVRRFDAPGQLEISSEKEFMLPPVRPLTSKPVIGRDIKVLLTLRVQAGQIIFSGDDAAVPSPKTKPPPPAAAMAQKRLYPRFAVMAAQRRFADEARPPSSSPSGYHAGVSVTGEADSQSTSAAPSSSSRPDTKKRRFELDTPAINVALEACRASAGPNSIAGAVEMLAKPISLSPFIFVFLEEVVEEVKQTLSLFAESPRLGASKPRSNVEEDLDLGPRPSRSSLLRRGMSDNGVDELGRSNSMHSGISATGADEPAPRSLTMVSISVNVPYVELNVRSAPSAAVGLKLTLPTGIRVALSVGKVHWADDQLLSATSVFVPHMALVVHELAPVLAWDVTHVRMGLHSLYGVLDGNKPFNTALVHVGTVKGMGNIRRADKLFELEHEFRRAWATVRVEQAKAAATTRQSNLRAFENALRRVLRSSSTRSQSSGLGADNTWSDSVTAVCTVRLGPTSFEAQLGVLHSTLEASVSHTAMRLALPGQLPGARNADPDTLFVELGLTQASLRGNFDGGLRLDKGLALFLLRDKPASPPSYADWQTWYANKTTMNRVALDVPMLEASLARLSMDEAVKSSRSRLFLLSSSGWSVRLFDATDKDGTLVIDLTLALDKLDIKSSVDALPIAVEAMLQLKEQLAMARGKAIAHEPPVALVPSPSSSGLGTKTAPSGDLDSLRAFMASGTVRVRVEALSVALIQEDLAWCSTTAFLGARLIVKRSEADCVLRDLTLQTGGAEVFRTSSNLWVSEDAPIGRAGPSSEDDDASSAAVFRGAAPAPPTAASTSASVSSGPPVSLEEASRRAQQARQTLAARKAKKVILTFPRFKIVMLTTQALSVEQRLHSTVFYKFTSTFRDPIGVSTDRREYARLREVLELVKVEHGKAEWGDSSPSASEDQRLFEMDERGGTPAFVLEPQLDIMGEATSTVLDWFLGHLDLDKSKLPKKVHLALADPLENVLASVCAASTRVDGVFEQLSSSVYES